MPLYTKLTLGETLVVNGVTVTFHKLAGRRTIELGLDGVTEVTFANGTRWPRSRNEPEPGVPEAMKEIFGDGNE